MARNEYNGIHALARFYRDDNQFVQTFAKEYWAVDEMGWVFPMKVLAKRYLTVGETLGRIADVLFGERRPKEPEARELTEWQKQRMLEVEGLLKSYWRERDAGKRHMTGILDEIKEMAK